ncbi:MAG: FtsL-like putative cell division protein [Microscillaceae bacterium]|nr:FtsL-like putative cell division protein [Microscillaceae bacterium]MDW8459884.1 FtsL-like putative cell division protein [Cytophagales bacterium]
MVENLPKKLKQPKPENLQKRAKRTINSFFEVFGEIDTSLDAGLSTKYIPYLLFLAVLAILYIANAHQAEKMVRKINKLEAEVENARADYITLKVEYMYLGKQSEISKRAAELGLSQEVGKIKRITTEPPKEK